MVSSPSRPRNQAYTFHGKHVLITGGCNGIGLCLARLALERGARVTLVDIANSDALKSLEAIKKRLNLSGDVIFRKADVGVYDQIAHAVKSSEDALGPIDCLIPNAGIASGGLFLDEPIEELEKVTRVNYMGVVYTLKAGLPGLVQRGQGRVLLLGSMMAMYAGFCASSYAAPKAAVLALANALRLELLGTGVGLTIAMPAFADTAMRTKGLENDRSPTFAKQLTMEMKNYSPDVVAELALQGVEQNLFFAKNPDLISNMAIASLAGVAPRVFNIFLEWLLLPVYFFLHLRIRWRLDRRILDWRAGEGGVKKAEHHGRHAGAQVTIRANSDTKYT